MTAIAVPLIALLVTAAASLGLQIREQDARQAGGGRAEGSQDRVVPGR